MTFEEDYHRTVTQLMPDILVNVTYHLDNKPLIIIIILCKIFEMRRTKFIEPNIILSQIFKSNLQNETQQTNSTKPNLQKILSGFSHYVIRIIFICY